MSELKLPTRLIRFALVAAAAVALVGFWWLTRRSDNIAFLPRHAGAEWIVFPTPANTAIIPALPTPARFRVEFTLASLPADATVEFAANRPGRLQVNRNPALALDGRDWKSPRAANVTVLLRPGTNLLELIVTNTFGPPTAWLRLRAGDTIIATDVRWEVSLAGSAWRPAALARARPQILPGNLLYATKSESGAASAGLLLFTLAIAAGVALAWPALKGRVQLWLESPRWWLWPGVVIAVLWVALAFNNLPQLPRLYGFDVEGHEEYIRYIQQRHALPLATDGWQMYQPPLYYWLGAKLLDVAGYSVDDEAAVPVLRGFSIVIGLAHCAVIFLCLRLLFPTERWKQVVGTLLAAFLPAHLVVSHYITNENLCALWVTLSFYFFLCGNLVGDGVRSLSSPGDATTRASSRRLLQFGACGGALGLALLTKFSAVLVLPALLGAVGWRILSAPGRSMKDWLRPVGLLLLALVVVCGWHYARVWQAFGTPLVGNWDAASGFTWWQFPGYRTADYYSSFGAALTQPLFSSVHGFADGLYSTFWADGLASGSATMAFNPPWNYGLMNAASLLALLGSGLFLAGLVVCLTWLWRGPRAESVLFMGFVLLLGLGLTYMALRVASYAQVKAFYGLSALLPLCVFFVTGCEWIARRGARVRGLAVGLFLAWAGMSFASLWVRSANPQTNVAQGIWLFDRGQFEPAVQRFQRALELEPRNTVAGAREVETLVRLGRIPEAVALAERSCRLEPENPALHLQLAGALNQLGDTNRADAEWREAVRFGPQEFRAWQQLALRDWRSGNSATAVTAAREALAISPYEPTLHALLGINLATLDDRAGALWHLDYACKLKPDFAIAQSQLGRLLLTTGDASHAVAHLVVAVNANPNDLEARRNHALALQQSGQGVAAVQAWRATLQLAPEQPDLLNNLAWLLATDRDDSVRNGVEAVTLAQRACELTGRQQPALLGTLAAAHAAAGEFTHAVQIADEAIALARRLNLTEIEKRNMELREMYRAARSFRTGVPE